MIRDPDVELVGDVPIELVVERFRAGRPRIGQYRNRTPEELKGDVTRVTDISLRLITERDALLKEKSSAEIEANSAMLWIKILSGTLGAAALVIGFLATELFARL